MLNLFSNMPETHTDEIVENIINNNNVRLERIVSYGTASPDGFWYDQNDHEWIVLLQGEAKLSFENEEELVHLHVGDCKMISAHQRHRVEWTTPHEPTIWLALFFRD